MDLVGVVQEPVEDCIAKRGIADVQSTADQLRNNHESRTLLDFCALVGSVIVDEDGVYDPRSVKRSPLVGHEGHDAGDGVVAVASALGRSAQAQGGQGRAAYHGGDRLCAQRVRSHRTGSGSTHSRGDRRGAVDPTNRLVDAELERRWNERLAVVSQRQAQIDALDLQAGPSLTAEQREALLALGSDLPRAWRHPAAGNEGRKRILRAVIKEIVARVTEARIEPVIHWQGGDHTALNVAKNRWGQHRWTTDVEVQALIPQLARQLNDASIVQILEAGALLEGGEL